MNNTSQQSNYITISDGEDTVYTVTLDGNLSDINMASTIMTDSISTITIPGTGSYTIGSGGDASYVFDNIDLNFGEEWIDNFPGWHRVQDMCKKYPGLDIALKNFKVVYEMVKDDYDSPKDD